MIRINELRVGNLMLENSEVYELESVDVVPILKHRKSGIRSLKWMPLSTLNPIPITPEILEMCGFEKDIHRPETMVLLVIGNLYFSSLMNNKNCIRLFSDKDAQSGEGVYIQYLHQLQNLFFALAGGELQINLP